MRLPWAGIVQAGASTAMTLIVALPPRPAQACSCIALTDFLCSRTRLMTYAAEDLALLGSGLPPDPSLEAEDMSSAAAGASGCVLTSRAQPGSGTLGVLIAAALAFMRRRARRT